MEDCNNEKMLLFDECTCEGPSLCCVLTPPTLRFPKYASLRVVHLLHHLHDHLLGHGSGLHRMVPCIASPHPVVAPFALGPLAAVHERRAGHLKLESSIEGSIPLSENVAALCERAENVRGAATSEGR